MERGSGSSNSQPKKGVPRSAEANINGEQQGFKRDPDQYMPITNLMRIMRRVLPDNTKVADDVKETIQECVSEFISFITREANERCHQEYRRTVTPNDVVSAMAALGFHNYVEPLTIFISKHHSAQDQYYPPCTAVQQAPAQMVVVPPPPPPPQTTVGAYVPSPPPPLPLNTVDSVNYLELPQMRDYFMNSRGGGGKRNSDDMEFDPCH